jgi:type III restriction enzyme
MVPASKKQRAKAKEGQQSLELRPGDELSSTDQAYDPTPIINEIRARVADWRRLPS